MDVDDTVGMAGDECQRVAAGKQAMAAVEQQADRRPGVSHQEVDLRIGFPRSCPCGGVERHADAAGGHAVGESREFRPIGRPVGRCHFGRSEIAARSRHAGRAMCRHRRHGVRRRRPAGRDAVPWRPFPPRCPAPGCARHTSPRPGQGRGGRAGRTVRPAAGKFPAQFGAGKTGLGRLRQALLEGDVGTEFAHIVVGPVIGLMPRRTAISASGFRKQGGVRPFRLVDAPAAAAAGDDGLAQPADAGASARSGPSGWPVRIALRKPAISMVFSR